MNKLNYYQEKQNENKNNKSKFKEQKEQNIKVIENLIKNFESDMEHKREVFKRIQPATDKYLSELGASYLAEYVPSKANIDTGIDYNEQTVNKYLANVQDYYKLIQAWDEANKGIQTDDNKELNKLREDMKQKLDGFEKTRIISKKMINNMRSELKNGTNIEDIIKNSSLEIINQNMNSSFVSNPYKLDKKDHNNSSMINSNSQLPTEMLNNNMSGSGNASIQNMNQSGNLIIAPNNNSSTLNNFSGHQENNKVAEHS